MYINIQINEDSKASELIALSNFAAELALTRGAPVSSGNSRTNEAKLTVPADPVELSEPETVVAQAGAEPPKRRRRTKEEIAADNAKVTQNEPSAESSTELPAEAPVPEEPVGAEPGTVPAETPAQEPEEFETVGGEAGNKEYTADEVQKTATIKARQHGADKIKALIKEAGAERIASMTQEQLNTFGAALDALEG